MGQRRGAYGVLVTKPGGRRPLVRAGRRWENNIEMNILEVGEGGVGGGGGMDWIIWLRIGTGGGLL